MADKKLEELVDFCGVKLQRSDKDAIYELFQLAGENPEDYYSANDEREIGIKDNRIYHIIIKDNRISYINTNYINNLSYIPESIGNLTNLKELVIPDNQLTSLPESIGNLTNLQGLYVPLNKLISIPYTIENLTNLKEFYVFNNQLNKESIKLCEKLKAKGVKVEIQQKHLKT